MLKFLLPISLIALAIIFGFYFFQNYSNKPTPKTSIPSATRSASNLASPTSSPSATQTKLYQSKNLKFSVVVPADFQPEEKLTTINLSKGNMYIQIARVAINYNNIQDYVQQLSKLNNFNLTQKESSVINGYHSIDGIIKSTGEEKDYFILVDGWVFTISTNSRVLYNNLDQIAQSFKYIP